jgi:hypothetical protein
MLIFPRFFLFSKSIKILISIKLCKKNREHITFHTEKIGTA